MTRRRFQLRIPATGLYRVVVTGYVPPIATRRTSEPRLELIQRGAVVAWAGSSYEDALFELHADLKLVPEDAPWVRGVRGARLCSVLVFEDVLHAAVIAKVFPP